MSRARDAIRVGAAGLAIAMSTWSVAARAADATSLAEALFVEGRKLMEQGRYDDACEKLDESQRLDPGGGTRMNLALCREKQGRLATSWSMFKLALADARRDGRDDRVAFAEQHLAELEPRLPSLVVRLSAHVRPDRVTVTLDGVALGAAALGVAVPIDPGAHEVALVTPDGGTTRFLVVAREGVRADLELGPAPRAAARSTRHTWGLVSAGAGAVSLAVGASFFLVARRRQADANAVCAGEVCRRDQTSAVDDNASAHRWARAADVALVLGAAGLGVGGYLLVTEPNKSALAPAVSPGAASVTFVRSF